jgi:hypothetical protein
VHAHYRVPWYLFGPIFRILADYHDSHGSAARDFVVDGRGQRLRDVQQHLPLWEQIEQVLKQAEAKSGDDVVRPSRRK